MFIVTEADVTAIRAAFEREGELSVAIELRRPFPLDHRQRDRAGARPHYRWVEADARDAAPGDAAVSRQGSIELLFRGVGRNGSVAGRRTAEDRKRLIRREKFLDEALGDTFHATDPILPMSFVPLKGRDS